MLKILTAKLEFLPNFRPRKSVSSSTNYKVSHYSPVWMLSSEECTNVKKKNVIKPFLNDEYLPKWKTVLKPPPPPSRQIKRCEYILRIDLKINEILLKPSLEIFSLVQNQNELCQWNSNDNECIVRSFLSSQLQGSSTSGYARRVIICKYLLHRY